ncbi:unnamed protein product [Rotaria sp. Silwood1]|nr:unnamed protein product [Rotaria sp. Silwood1]CAF5132903.1 unnamed protein product [Rotaria sp. Silwood1]
MLSLLTVRTNIKLLCNLNTRLTILLMEGNFCCPVNLSPTRYFQFQTFLSLLQLNKIQLLVINCYASPLQLRV